MKTDLIGTQLQGNRGAMENSTLHGRCAACTRDGVDTRSKDLTDACIEKQELACDSCGGVSVVRTWMGTDGQAYHSCESCWIAIQESVDELQSGLTECEHADHETEEETDKECSCTMCCTDPVPQQMCDDCKRTPATKTFNHLDGRSFALCVYCFQLADHEDDYGVDFVRSCGSASLCSCAVVCDPSGSVCLLCSGLVL
jgi:hypothetical protein